MDNSNYSRITRMMTVFSRLMRVAHHTNPRLDIPKGSFGILMSINMHREHSGQDSIRLGQLCRMMHRQMPSVTRSVNMLESDGYVVRTTTSDDRRAVYVGMTDKGREALGQAHDMMFAAIGGVLDKLDKNEFAQLEGTLEHINKIIDEMYGEKS